METTANWTGLPQGSMLPHSLASVMQACEPELLRSVLLVFFFFNMDLYLQCPHFFFHDDN